MAEVETASGPPGERHKRHLRNYLLDKSFQLKYANFVAAIALVISCALGWLLWRTSSEMVEQSQAAVALGNEVIDESLKVSEVVRMNIVKDPIYSENPVLKEAFEADAAKQNAELLKNQEELKTHAAWLQNQSKRFFYMLVGVLGALVIALWLAGIVITHRVAGPVYKMKRQIRELARGNFQVPSPLRKGDELKDFFDAFIRLVESLRTRQEAEIQQIDEVLEALPNEEESSRRKLKELRDKMAASLD